MKAKEILFNVIPLPCVPFGLGIHSGNVLKNVAEERNDEFIDVTNHFDPCKDYIVAWDPSDFSESIEIMGTYDLIIISESFKKYCWEIED